VFSKSNFTDILSVQNQVLSESLIRTIRCGSNSKVDSLSALSFTDVQLQIIQFVALTNVGHQKDRQTNGQSNGKTVDDQSVNTPSSQCFIS